ncbi:MAG TPA: hypothetical protein VGK97_05725 [Spongiibacteraceae bacterium]
MLDFADYTTVWDHTFAWSVYLAAAFVFLLAYLRLTRRWQADIRWLLGSLLTVFLLVPAPVPGRALLAPAMIFVVLSPFTGTPELIASVLVRLMLGAIAAIVLVIIAGVVRRLRRRA